MTHDLRYIVRQATRDAHDQLDRLVSSINIGRASGLQTFLQTHLDCFSAMQVRVTDASLCGNALAEMVDALRSDLCLFPAHPINSDVILKPTLDPLAIDYIVAGSRLGTKVLYKEWVGSTDPVVRQANGYFGLVNAPTLWPETCRALSLVPANSARADTIVADTRTLFQLFTSVFQVLASDQDVLA